MRFLFGALLGLALSALSRTSRERCGAQCGAVFIQVFQGTPLLLQLFSSSLARRCWGLTSTLGGGGRGAGAQQRGLSAEIWRGCSGRAAWPVGGRQALNLGYVARMRFVVLPQAFKIALPPTVGYMVTDHQRAHRWPPSSVSPRSRPAGQIINNATFQPLPCSPTVAALYFVIYWPLSLLAARMSAKRSVLWR